jgi:hypothetical protein
LSRHLFLIGYIAAPFLVARRKIAQTREQALLIAAGVGYVLKYPHSEIRHAPCPAF